MMYINDLYIACYLSPVLGLNLSKLNYFSVYASDNHCDQAGREHKTNWCQVYVTLVVWHKG